MPPGRCRRRAQRSLRGPAEQGTGVARISCQLRARRCRAGHSAAPAVSHSVPGLGPGKICWTMSATRSGCRTRREPPEAPAQRRPVTPGPGPAPVARLRGQTASLLGACAADRPAERRVAIGDRELTASMVAVTGAIKITIHGQDISVVCARQPVPPDLTVVLLPIAPLRITPGTGPGLFADPVRRPGSAARPSQSRRPACRLPRPPAASPRRARSRRRLNRARGAGQSAAIPANPAGLYQ